MATAARLAGPACAREPPIAYGSGNVSGSSRHERGCRPALDVPCAADAARRERQQHDRRPARRRASARALQRSLRIVRIGARSRRRPAAADDGEVAARLELGEPRRAPRSKGGNRPARRDLPAGLSELVVHVLGGRSPPGRPARGCRRWPRAIACSALRVPPTSAGPDRLCAARVGGAIRGLPEVVGSMMSARMRRRSVSGAGDHRVSWVEAWARLRGAGHPGRLGVGARAPCRTCGGSRRCVEAGEQPPTGILARSNGAWSESSPRPSSPSSRPRGAARARRGRRCRRPARARLGCRPCRG